ncbi:predicted protein [Uncinocarpus reesii 1704]|uniref:L-dopachrome isomerase n=1 Tax=Uncinocarpus reesii (strain UAMH 1704) TaxID=336963 RepID=C4JIQ4_UNCRE|nr:uncharacterized protein UREG_02915 [Uncinocarpus reesii 1704]EEP78066.1 predicted protein [Uncinocarpus reesii 1704]
MEQTRSNDSSMAPPKEIPVLLSPSSYKHRQAKEAQAKQSKLVPKQQESPAIPASTRNDELSRELHRGAPTDDTRLKHSLISSPGQRELARQRNQYFNEAFGLREPYHTSRHRVNQDSIVVVEIKTNLQAEDGVRIVSDMTFSFAQIFQRPESSMMIVLDDRAYLGFGASAEPAYLMTVSALPHMVKPTMNMRHTALIQSAMEEILGISKDRGVVKFISMNEESFATNGSTIKDEIEQMERTSHEENGLMKTISRSMTRRAKPNTTKNTTPTAQPNHSRRTPVQRTSTEDESPKAGVLIGPSSGDSGRKVKKYKSLAKLFSH